MDDRATAFDRMMNPWAYDTDGNLTAQARAQEQARGGAPAATRLNSADGPGGPGGTGFTADTDALNTAASNSDQIHGRLTSDGRGADEATTKVGTALANWATGKAATTAAGNWDQCIDALAKSIGETAQLLRTSATNYQQHETSVRRDLAV
ncbi:hypothetical protein ACIG5E_19225 [Kitasatospora sp. NPDC053057]|uniref:hypothetical protein n=1 Tax=Kitasatospora sp. NPDC053057 TaxID=3364062 RepID=UPI0037CC8521